MDMGLLRFVKAASAKIFGATETAAAPPERWEQDAETPRLDVTQVDVNPSGKVVLSGSTAAKEEAEKIKPATDDPVGVAAVQDNIAAAAEAGGSKFYTVQPGDTLGKIAAAEYGPGHAGEYHRILLKPISLCCPMPIRSIQAKCCGFFRFRAEGLRMKRREDIFESCALAG
jgi:nucleoid-associated protein YgaU